MQDGLTPPVPGPTQFPLCSNTSVCPGSHQCHAQGSTDKDEGLSCCDPGGSNPGGSNPGGSAPGGSNPGGSNPGGSNPGKSTPGRSNPGGSTPGESTPGRSYPGGSNPGGPNPGGPNPGGSTPGGSNPGGSAPPHWASGSLARRRCERNAADSTTAARFISTTPHPCVFPSV